jgi:hypothetical protein
MHTIMRLAIGELIIRIKKSLYKFNQDNIVVL